MLTLFLLIISYLLGSIPFGYLMVRLVKKTDIRQHGSGNIGATNVVRVFGKGLGIPAFVLDVAKGFIPPLLIKLIIPESANFVFVFSAILAVCGHNWPVFLKFKGGKGVATSLGGIFGLSLVFPILLIALGAALIIWIVVFVLSKTVSIASLSASFIFFVTSLISPLPFEVKLLTFALFSFIIFRHKNNIKNLKNNKELKF